MNIAKLSVLPWLGLYEASHYLTSKLNCGPYGSENGISECDVLQLALAGRFPLTLDIPPGMKDKQDREFKDGLWDLLMARERGKPGRRQVKHQCDQSVSVKGIEGAWVARKVAGSKVVRQLQPRGRGAGELPSAFPEGVVLGVRTKALNAFAKKNGQAPPKAAEQLDPRERQTYLKLIAGLALHGRFTEFTGAAFAQVTDLIGGKHGVSVKAATEKINQLYDEAEEKGWDRRLPPRSRAKKKTKSGQR